MSKWEIDGTDFYDMEAEKFWSFGKKYKGDAKQETKGMVLSGEYTGSLKKDGHYFRLVKAMDGECALLSRSLNVNGNYTNKVTHIPHLYDFLGALPNGTCLLTEIYYPDWTSRNVQTIMGCDAEKAIRRQEEDLTPMHMYIFDVIAFDGESLVNTPHQTRTTVYMDKVHEYSLNELVEFAEFYEGQKLAEKIEEALESGEEGYVLTLKSALVEPGKRPVRKTLKIKKELANDLDVFFTGIYTEPTEDYEGDEFETWQYWQNTHTGEKLEGTRYCRNYFLGENYRPISRLFFLGYAASLEIGCLKGKEIYPIGYISTLEDSLKKAVVEDPESIALKPMRVSAMQFTHTGKLRHSVFKGFRDDINLSDCTYEKIFE